MKIEIVVPVSGGKDSQACLKLAVEDRGPERVIGMFSDTQFEHPMTYAHVDRIAALYGVSIVKLCAGSVPEKVTKYRRFPGGGARHCTEELKIVPGNRFFKALAEKQGGFEVWFGMRSDESTQRRARYAGRIADDLYAPHDFMAKCPKYLAKLGVMIRLPIIDWSARDVFDYLDGTENPLYREGFDRVGCFPCLAAGDRHKEKAFSHDETGRAHYAEVQRLEKIVGRPVWTSKGGRQRNNPDQDQLFDGCALCKI